MRETSDLIARTRVLARMPPRQMIFVAGVAAGSFVLSDQSDAQPTSVAVQPLKMSSSHTCDGLRELMIDTVVHQAVVGSAPSYDYGGRHRYRHGRQLMSSGIKRRPPRKHMAKPDYAPMSEGDAAAPAAGRVSYDFSGEYWSAEQ